MKLHTTQQGFSLVETLVAITILLIVIVGPMTISSSTARSTSFSSEQVTAFFLAQEGAELVQLARDTMLLERFNTGSGDNWDTFADNSGSGPLANCYTANGCRLELNTDNNGTLKAINSCGSTLDDCRLYISGSSPVTRSRYTYDTTTEPTPYTRSIKLDRISADEVQVISEVSWRTGNQRQRQSVVVETQLFNVYDF